MDFTWEQFLEFLTLILNSKIARITIGGFIIFFIAMFLRRLTRTVFKRGKLLSMQESDTMIALIHSIIKYVAAIVFTFYILAVFGLDVGGMLAGAGVIGIIIGFGAQSTVQDLLAGLFIVYEKQLKKGDFVIINDLHWGTVEEIGFRILKIRKWAGTVLSINNGEVESIENYNEGNMRIIEQVTASFYQDPSEVVRALEAACVVLNRKLDQHLIKDFDGRPIEPFKYIGTGNVNDNYRGYSYYIVGVVDDKTYWQTARDARGIIAQTLFDYNIKMPEQPILMRDHKNA